MEDKILCNVSDLEPIADAVREKENTNKLYSVEELKVKVPELIGSGSGIELPVLTNPATASDALSGKEFIDGDGNKVTGTIATKTSSNLTASGATVTVPAGYYASQVTKSVATATQAIPSVSIDNTGKITATATQIAGYVSAGTKTGEKQLTTQGAKTITPTKSAQTAVTAGRYTTGVVTVAAIPDQYQDITTPLSELNAANGGTAATTISAAVDNTEALANSQENLIAQIASALENKAAAGGSGSASLETGILTGVTTMAAELTGKNTTYYYDLESIPNITSKKMIYFRDTAHVVYLFLLTRSNLNEQFTTVENSLGNSTYNAPKIVVTDYMMSLTTDTTAYSSLYYYAA